VGFAVTPLYFVWEKLIGIHTTKNMLLRAVCRMPVILPVWFFAIAFPFFGPINSTVGAMFLSFCEKNPLHSFGSQKNDTEADEVTILSLAAECCCEAPFLHVELGSNLPHQHIHPHLDNGNWHWMGWLGKHHNFQA
jgi:hypothetical protein